MKNEFKKINAIFASVFLAISFFSIIFCISCNQKNQESQNSKEIKIVATAFPFYDWTKNIIGDSNGIKIDFLMTKGSDPHSFQPGVEELAKVSEADLFIFAGGESDDWAKDAIKNSVNKNQTHLNLLSSLGALAKEEEDFEGEEESCTEEKEFDEHIWLSLKNADFLCKIIAKKICELNPNNKETYEKNLEAYSKKICELDKEYAQLCGTSKNHAVLFGDRFPFMYLMQDYEIDYFAAFSGCSAESEASFETIIKLASKIDELSLKSILTLENSDKKIAESIKSSTKSKNQKILTLDSMQSITKKELEEGITYLAIMKKNLEVLKTALN